MNHKIKQVAVRVSRASKSLFQGTSSRSNRREAILRCVDPELGDRPIAFQRSNDEVDKQCGEEVENEEDTLHILTERLMFRSHGWDNQLD
jgi:hypothetical protein